MDWSHWIIIELRLTKHEENCSEPEWAIHVWSFLSPLLMEQVSHFLLCHSSECIVLPRFCSRTCRRAVRVIASGTPLKLDLGIVVGILIWEMKFYTDPS